MHRCRDYIINADGSVDFMWRCTGCDSLSPYLQHHLVAVNRICGTASFYVWDGVPANATSSQTSTAKAELPVWQPAHIASWLYVGLGKL